MLSGRILLYCFVSLVCLLVGLLVCVLVGLHLCSSTTSLFFSLSPLIVWVFSSSQCSVCTTFSSSFIYETILLTKGKPIHFTHLRLERLTSTTSRNHKGAVVTSVKQRRTRIVRLCHLCNTHRFRCFSFLSPFSCFYSFDSCFVFLPS